MNGHAPILVGETWPSAVRCADAMPCEFSGISRLGWQWNRHPKEYLLRQLRANTAYDVHTLESANSRGWLDMERLLCTRERCQRDGYGLNNQS